MLQVIRDHAQGIFAWIIVGIISVPFALWGIHEYLRPTPKDVVATVNGVELSQEEFRLRLQQLRQRFRAMFRQNDLSSFEEQIKSSALDSMIEEEVLMQATMDAGLRIGDNLLATSIHSISAFQENEKFSQTIYEQHLRNLGWNSPAAFERQMRRDLLTDQLQKGVTRSAFVTPYDHQIRARLEQQQRLVSYLTIPTSRFAETVTVTDAEVQTYYTDHAKQYMTPEKVSVEYAELTAADVVTHQEIEEATLQEQYNQRLDAFTTSPEWHARHLLIAANKDAPPNEVAAAEKQAQELLTRIRNGESFVELVRQHSQDEGTAKNGGDLGWFGRGRMVAPFEQAVASMKTGDTSELVKTDFGFHIIQLLDTKPERIRLFAEVREELKKILEQEQAEFEFHGRADQFANLAFEHPDSLDVIAKEFNLKLQVSEWFDRAGGDKKGILAHQNVIDAAFSDGVLKEGYNSEVIRIDDFHIVVLRLKEHEMPQAQPLETVKDGIVTALKREKMEKETKLLGETIVQALKEKQDPLVVQAHQLQWSPPQWIQRQDTTLKQPQLVSEAFKMGHPTENAALYKGIGIDNGDYALLAVLAIQEGTAEEKKSAELQKTDLQSALGLSDFNQLVSALKASAKIEIH